MQVRVELELGLLIVADELHDSRWNAGLPVLIYVRSSCVLTVLFTERTR